MRRPVRPFFRPLDLLVLALLAAGAAYPLLRGDAGEAASAVEISDAGGVVETVPLTADRTVSVTGPLGETVVVVGRGGARIVSSPCPERLCLSGGPLTRPGQSAICLPNLVAVTIRGAAAPGDLDAVSR